MTKECTWADLEAAIGQDFSGGESSLAAEPVEYTAIRRICEALKRGCPLHWDDVNIGDAMPAMSMNLTVQRLVMVAGAIRNFDYMHHDTVLTQKSGVEEMYAASTFVQGIWERAIREYIGTKGIIRKVGPFRMGVFNQAGFTVTTKGTVRRKYQDDGENRVELEVWSENDRGVSVGPGPVVVALPMRR